MSKADFDAGIKAASELLICTAEDYEQIHARLLALTRPTEYERKEAKLCEDKAKLLRGQAGNILRIKQN